MVPVTGPLCQAPPPPPPPPVLGGPVIPPPRKAKARQPQAWHTCTSQATPIAPPPESSKGGPNGSSGPWGDEPAQTPCATSGSEESLAHAGVAAPGQGTVRHVAVGAWALCMLTNRRAVGAQRCSEGMGLFNRFEVRPGMHLKTYGALHVRSSPYPFGVKSMWSFFLICNINAILS